MRTAAVTGGGFDEFARPWLRIFMITSKSPLGSAAVLVGMPSPAANVLCPKIALFIADIHLWDSAASMICICQVASWTPLPVFPVTASNPLIRITFRRPPTSSSATNTALSVCISRRSSSLSSGLEDLKTWMYETAGVAFLPRGIVAGFIGADKRM